MTSGLVIGVETQPIERASAEIAVVSFFETERPLRGDAGRADWRLCGLLTDLLRAGRLTGRIGEAALVPTFGRLRAPRLMVLGLGPSAGFGALEVKAVARDAIARVLRLGLSEVAFALPGAFTGLLPPGPSAGAVLRGAAIAVAGAPAPLRCQILIGEAQAAKALAGLETAWRALPDGGAAVRVQLPAAPALPGPRGMPLPAAAVDGAIPSLSQRH